MSDVPQTVAEAMRSIADFMRLLDKCVALLAAISLEPQEVGDRKQVRGDLLMWASWLEEHPEVDARMAEVSSIAEMRDA